MSNNKRATFPFRKNRPFDIACNSDWSYFFVNTQVDSCGPRGDSDTR